ncbi:MAG: hypothetical protein ACOC2Y_09725 [Spirochaetota bacterium]
MKRAFGVIIVAVALLGACATAPEPADRPDEAYETAKTLRSQIQEFDLAQYARSEFDAGEEQFTEGEVAYESEDYTTAETAFNFAIDSYTIVIRDGFRALAGAAREEATEQRAFAEEVRADIALAEAYQEALAVYEDAVAAEDAGNDQEAAELFDSAALLFAQVYEDAALLREGALEALGRVDERIRNLDVQRETLEEETRRDLEGDETNEEEAE